MDSFSMTHSTSNSLTWTIRFFFSRTFSCFDYNLHMLSILTLAFLQGNVQRVFNLKYSVCMNTLRRRCLFDRIMIKPIALNSFEIVKKYSFLIWLYNMHGLQDKDMKLLYWKITNLQLSIQISLTTGQHYGTKVYLLL